MVCPIPFTELHVLHRRYTTCCGAWLDPDVHVVQPQSDAPWAVWNHPKVQRLRAAVLKNDYSYCRRCPARFGGDPAQKARPDWKPIMVRGPARINLGNDQTCNLHCSSCRPGPIGRLPDVGKRSDVAQAFVAEFLQDLRRLSLSHAGDPFVSPVCQTVLASIDGPNLPRLRIELFTNGLLLPGRWQSLGHLHANIDAVNISIDAATKPTYEALRRGGCWEDLRRTLYFVARLRESRALERFQANFCVQAANFFEAPEFVELMLGFQATHVVFNLLRPRYRQPAVYARKNVADPAHPFHSEFLTMLSDPRLAHPDVHAPMLSAAGRQSIREAHGDPRPHA